MASIVLQAADTRLLMPNGSLMIHGASVTLNNYSAHALKSYLRMLGYSEEFMLNLFAEKCAGGPFFKERGYNVSKVKTYLKRKIIDNTDWYLDASEALNLGMIDGIIGSKEYPSVDVLKKM